MDKNELLNQLDKEVFYRELIPSLKRNGSSQATGLCPFHDDRNPSLSMNMDNGFFHCFGCNTSGDLFTFYMKLKGVDFPMALKEIEDSQGLSSSIEYGRKKLHAPRKESPKVVAIYPYPDELGNLLYFKERWEPGKNGRSKELYFKHPVNGENIMGRGCAAILYKLPDLIKSKIVFVVEGENKVDALGKLGLVATCLDSGAKSPWREEYNRYFEGKELIIILPDNDVPGMAYAQMIAKELHGKVKTLKIVELPELKEKEDIIDWLEKRDAKSTEDIKSELKSIIKQVPDWSPETENLKLLSQLERWNDIQNLDIKYEWIVDKLIPKESITLIFGKGGIGKTWLSLDISKCIGDGIAFLGLRTIKVPVIFIDFENPLSVLNLRTKKLGSCENVYFWRANNDKCKAPKLDTKEWEQYKSLPKESVLIFDTLRASHSKDENSSEFMSNILERLKELRDRGHTIILLHHTPKNADKVAKGSTAIVDLADHILGLTKVKKKKDGEEVLADDDDDNDEDIVFRFGVRDKTRFDPHHIYLKLNPDRGFELAPDPDERLFNAMRQILEAQHPINKSDFVGKCKGDLGISIHKARGLVERGEGKYWNIERGEKNAKKVVPIQFVNSSPLYRGEKLTNTNSEVEISKKETNENHTQSIEAEKLVNSSESELQADELLNRTKELFDGIIDEESESSDE